MTSTEARRDGCVPHAPTATWPRLAAPPPAPVHAAVAGLLLRRAARLAGIRVQLADGRAWGPPDGPVLRVHDPDRFRTRLGRDGLLGVGESFMAGEWDADDLVATLTPLAARVDRLVPVALQRLRRFHDRPHPPAQDNDRDGARRNISRHYDLSNELFALFLDETMSYSCALFRDGDDLADAQRRKVDRLLDLARVGPGTRLAEIGTGWGELALRAAGRGARVTTVTLSVAQAELARARIAAAGLADRVQVRVQDYRDLDGQHDAVVSVEMVEAVGERWWPTYAATIDRLLAPGGRVALQAITMPHARMLASRGSHTWIQEYVFPGGLIPSERALDEAFDAHTTLRVVDRLHLGAHYARTLRCWRERFLARLPEVRALGFDDVFIRLWEFYLAYCEAGFRAGYLDDVQLLLTRDGAA